MIKFKDMGYSEQSDTALLLANWLKGYSHEVINHVMSKVDEIVNDENTMRLINELAKREDDEWVDFVRSIRHLGDDFETFSKYDPHNHALTHAKSYRDVLYDMYIADMHEGGDE